MVAGYAQTLWVTLLAMHHQTRQLLDFNCEFTPCLQTGQSDHSDTELCTHFVDNIVGNSGIGLQQIDFTEFIHSGQIRGKVDSVLRKQAANAGLAILAICHAALM